MCQVEVQTTTHACCCPVCGVTSTSIHSYRQRFVKDLPIGEHAVVLSVRTKRFRCRNPECPQVTFVEEIPGVVARHARRTARLSTVLWHIGQVAGGQAGARLTRQLHLAVSRATLLRIVRQHPIAPSPSPTIIGIDDWAKRKGQRYGTIVVDLERHRVVDLLEDRDAETVVDWLRTCPQVQVVARDRSQQYAQAVAEGAPWAIQVADRWHLLKNLSEMVQRVLLERLPRMTLKVQSSAYANAPREKFPRAASDLRTSAAVRARRMREYIQVQQLRQHGHSERRIARVLGMSRGKVHRLYHAKTVPERRSAYVPSMLDPFIGYLKQRVAAGCTNAQQLWRELRDRGYPGASGQVAKWVHNQRHRPHNPQVSSDAVTEVRLPTLPTCVRVLTADPTQLSPEDSSVLTRLQQDAGLAGLYPLAQHFMTMVRQMQPDGLNAWVDTCSNSPVAALRHFAASISQDLAAVRAALELPWSNGQTEGQIHRLKMLKRQMYGRAKLDLLRLRILYSP